MRACKTEKKQGSCTNFNQSALMGIQHLFISDSENESELDTTHLSKKISFLDKETLIQIIHSLYDSNKALRSYIDYMDKLEDFKKGLS